MKLSEHIKWKIANCEETNPSKIRQHLIEKYGVEVTIAEIRDIQKVLQEEFERVERKRTMKKKCYVLMIAKTFPAYHPRKDDLTDFDKKLIEGSKKHTIRGNYELWKKRIEEVNRGEAYISRRQWTGKPYASKQHEIDQLHKGHLGLQKLDKYSDNWLIDDYLKGNYTVNLAENDGLSVEDFNAWFPKLDLPMAIIHFTDFRYS